MIGAGRERADIAAGTGAVGGCIALDTIIVGTKRSWRNTSVRAGDGVSAVVQGGAAFFSLAGLEIVALELRDLAEAVQAGCVRSWVVER